MAKIADALGNELNQHDTVKWDFAPGRWVLASVEEVIPPGLVTDRDGQPTPGKLVLRVEIPVPYNGESSEQNYGYSELVKTFDPASGRLVNRLAN